MLLQIGAYSMSPENFPEAKLLGIFVYFKDVQLKYWGPRKNWQNSYSFEPMASRALFGQQGFTKLDKNTLNSNQVFCIIAGWECVGKASN